MRSVSVTPETQLKMLSALGALADEGNQLLHLSGKGSSLYANAQHTIAPGMLRAKTANPVPAKAIAAPPIRSTLSRSSASMAFAGPGNAKSPVSRAFAEWS